VTNVFLSLALPVKIDVTIDDVSRVRVGASGGSFRLLLAVDAFRAESVELSSLSEAKGRVLTLRVPPRDAVNGELSLISIPPSGLVNMLFGGHESQQACTGFFVVEDVRKVNKFTVFLVTDAVAPGRDPQVQAELKVTITCTQTEAAPPQPLVSAQPRVSALAASATSAAVSLSSSGERYRCKEFVAADYHSAAELALKFCNTVLDHRCRVISFSERPFGTTGAACVKVFYEVHE
jgi:hypothetical protein